LSVHLLEGNRKTTAGSAILEVPAVSFARDYVVSVKRYCLHRAFINARATINTGVGINLCLILYRNRLNRADLFAIAATRAFVSINFCCHFCFSFP